MGCGSSAPQKGLSESDPAALLVDDSTQMIREVPMFKYRAAGITHIGFGNLKKENQDDYCIHFNFKDDFSLFGVWDGHGQNGKHVSQFCKERTPGLIADSLTRKADSTQDVKDAVINSFQKVHRGIHDSGIDTSMSGSTGSVALVRAPEVYVGAAGDSRVVLGVRTPDPDVLIAEPLSIDHRPSRKDEAERIIKFGGRIQPKKNDFGQLVGEDRVWLRDMDMPGLMVTRTIGDEMGTSVGCIPDPEMVRKVIDVNKHKYLVLASDGVWDVMENEQVIEIVNKEKSLKDACKMVLKLCIQAWGETGMADNITLIVIRFYPEDEEITEE